MFPQHNAFVSACKPPSELLSQRRFRAVLSGEVKRINRTGAIRFSPTSRSSPSVITKFAGRERARCVTHVRTPRVTKGFTWPINPLLFTEPCTRHVEVTFVSTSNKRDDFISPVSRSTGGANPSRRIEISRARAHERSCLAQHFAPLGFLSVQRAPFSSIVAALGDEDCNGMRLFLSRRKGA